ncbi:MAG: hypothetical protein K0R54_719 [Clostridiaceae bacterium]|jgi:hypothetical protein|nr:hypothetical protein [Clostridiaceae bacterium]
MENNQKELIMEKNKKELTPTEYFDNVKGRKQQITDEELLSIYDNCLTLAKKYTTTGQVSGLRKLMFHLETIEKERNIVKMGINTFVYRDDIEEYIDNIANNAVKIIELENYEREIPDEIVEIIEKVKDEFTQLYVLYTDYTGKEEKRVEKIRRDKDPILFGTFRDEKSRTLIDRFYFLGDWIDEYCDLTLDKMVTEIKKKKGKDVTRTISTPTTIEELKQQLETLERKNGKNDVFVINNNSPKKTGFFSKIRTFLGDK